MYIYIDACVYSAFTNSRAATRMCTHAYIHAQTLYLKIVSNNANKTVNVMHALETRLF